MSQTHTDPLTPKRVSNTISPINLSRKQKSSGLTSSELREPKTSSERFFHVDKLVETNYGGEGLVRNTEEISVALKQLQSKPPNQEQTHKRVAVTSSDSFEPHQERIVDYSFEEK